MTVLDSRTRFEPVPDQRRRGRWRWLLVAAAGVAVIGWVVGWSPLLAVSQIRVQGNTTVSADQIRAAAGVTLGTPMARVNADAVTARVQALGPIAAVEVRRGWPQTLVLVVTERTPVVDLATAGGYELVDATGLAYAHASTRPAGLPQLIASGSAAVTAGAAAVAAMPATFRVQVVTVRASTADNILLTLNDGTRVRWGGADDGARKATVAAALLPVRAAVIDVSAPDLPTTVGVLRPAR